MYLTVALQCDSSHTTEPLSSVEWNGVYFVKMRNMVASEVEVVCCIHKKNARTNSIKGMAQIMEQFSQMRTNPWEKKTSKPTSESTRGRE